MLDPFFDFPDNVLYSKNISEGEHFLHAPSFGNRPAEELVSLKNNSLYSLNSRAQPIGRISGTGARRTPSCREGQFTTFHPVAGFGCSVLAEFLKLNIKRV